MIPQIAIADIIQFKRKHFSFKTQNKAFYVLTCRIKGESLFFYNNEEHLVKKGDILYIPAGSSYSQACEEETLICFHLSISGQVSPNIEIFSIKDQEKICELFVRAERLWRKKPSNYEFACMSILYEILSNVQICTDAPPPHATAVLMPAMAYLNAHLFDADLSWEQVCNAAHISRTYFNKLFDQTYGCTPTIYTNTKRIERAKQFLISGGFSNEEIALLCGFNDVKYFYVVFKKITGMTTKEYRGDFEYSQ
jgi:AraC-like DNA-binding protein